MGWLILGIILGAIGALLVRRALFGNGKRGYWAETEYWIYTDAEKLPNTNLVMDRMISRNPHNRPGEFCIGRHEGMIFSDVRLHIGLARKEKNPFAFRPDLFSEEVVPCAEKLKRITSAGSIIKLRYFSRAELKDDRHLQFMPHLADAVADLTEGTIVFDRITGQLWTREEFQAELHKNPRANRPNMHVRVLWDADDEGGQARTRGLRKMGLPEIETWPVPHDMEVLVQGLVIRLAQRALRDRQIPEQSDIQEFDDNFHIVTAHDGAVVKAHITRQRNS